MVGVSERTDQILQTVTRLLEDVMGETVDVGAPISFQTSFSHDLELESIEFVALAEQIREHYGERVDFAAWLSGMELDQILQLSVGDLVRFIDSCLI